jgi:hypothetical protein
MSGAPTMTEDQIANLSDEELMNMAFAPELESPPQETEEAPETEEADAGEGGSDDAVNVSESAEDGSDELARGDEEEAAPPAQAETAPVETAGAPEEKEVKDTPATESVSPGQDYKALYEKIMGPFKANGKEIKLQSPEEAIQLMQMGANYTKKLQALQPNLRLLKMLENNNLLDEGKLSFLIDLDRRNPEAVQKLIKDSGIDPLDIDTTAEPNYKPGNYRVSDEDMRFTSTLEEVSSNPAGKEVILTINKTWDNKSKEVLWSDPEILRVLTEQKEQGIYDRVAAEVERLRMLGTISSTTPFIEAYHAVGNVMGQRGEFAPKVTPNQGTAQPAATQQTAQPSRVVDTRAAPRRTVTNNDRAKAASPTRSTPVKAVQDFNPLAMSDEDFEKNTELAKRL